MCAWPRKTPTSERFPNFHSFTEKRGMLYMYRRNWCYPRHYTRQYLQKGSMRVKCFAQEHDTLGTLKGLSHGILSIDKITVKLKET